MLLKGFLRWLGGGELLLYAGQTKAFVMLDFVNKIDLAGLSPLP